MELDKETMLTSTSSVESNVAVEEDVANIDPAPDEKAPQLTEAKSQSVFTKPVVSFRLAYQKSCHQFRLISSSSLFNFLLLIV